MTLHYSKSWFWFPLITRDCTELSQCPLNIEHYSLNIAHWTLNIAHWTLHIAHCTLHIEHYTLNIAHYTLNIEHWTLHTVQWTLSTTNWILHSADCWEVSPSLVLQPFLSSLNIDRICCIAASTQLMWGLLETQLTPLHSVKAPKGFLEGKTKLQT